MSMTIGDLGIHEDVNSVQLYGQKTRPKVQVSIVIPTYQRQELFRQALLSALEQKDFDDYEILVVDNDPESELPCWFIELVEGYSQRNVCYFKNESNLGMTGNWNRGIELCCGEWISFLHDDDWLSPYFLVRTFNALPEGAKAIACRSERGNLSYRMDHVFKKCFHFSRLVMVSPCRMAAGNLADAPGILYRRSALIGLGGYADAFYPSADYYLNAKLVLSGGVYLLFERLAYYRISDSLTFKSNTLNRILVQSEKIRCLILRHDQGLATRWLAFTSTLWWYRVGFGRGFDLKGIFPRGRVLAVLSRVPGAYYLFRAVAGFVLYWK